MGAFDFYFLADEIADAQPDIVIMPLNLASLGRPWRNSFSRPELAGWIRPTRLTEALDLPLHWIGLTTDRLLLYVGMVQTGLFPTWRYVTRDQARTGTARELIEERTAGFFAGWPEERVREARKLYRLRAYMDLPRKRYAAPLLRTHWGAALDGVNEDNPVLQALGAAVRRLHAADISVIVYVVPINVEHIEAKGLLDAAGVRQTLDSAQHVVRSSGGTFVDLHDLFPDHGFRDAAGHFQTNEEFDGTRQVANALAPFVIESVSRSARRRD